MSKYLSFETIGNPKNNHFDAIIFAPHPSIDTNFIQKVRQTSKKNLDNISDEMLSAFLYHEADTGVNEVIDEMKPYLQKSNFSIGILKVEIPRGFCDLNRPLSRAIPEIFRDNSWEQLYTETSKKINIYLQNTDFVFHFHSMNGFSPVAPSNFDENVSEKSLENHIENIYSGKKRECTILTKTEQWEYITDAKFDEIFRKIFAENQITLEENTAYQFLEDYPCTQITKRIPSWFFELTKNSIATDATSHFFNTNAIIFESEKIQKFAKVLSEILISYLQKKS